MGFWWGTGGNVEQINTGFPLSPPNYSVCLILEFTICVVDNETLSASAFFNHYNATLTLPITCCWPVCSAAEVLYGIFTRKFVHLSYRLDAIPFHFNLFSAIAIRHCCSNNYREIIGLRHAWEMSLRNSPDIRCSPFMPAIHCRGLQLSVGIAGEYHLYLWSLEPLNCVTLYILSSLHFSKKRIIWFPHAYI